jgi:small subunit ribosomal protein S19
MAKEFMWHGMNWEQVQKLSFDEFAQHLLARERRTIRRGQNALVDKLYKDVSKSKKNIKTHCRDAIVTPAFVGTLIKIHNGKEFVAVTIEKEMIGHRLGEFAPTRKRVGHNAPGIGATRSSAAMSVR